MDRTVEKTISLVYSWLKENHLLKTSRSLEQEYGKEIHEDEGTSLTKIFQTYQALSSLLTSFVHPTQKTISSVDEDKENNARNKKVSRKRKNSTSEKGDGSENPGKTDGKNPNEISKEVLLPKWVFKSSEESGGNPTPIKKVPAPKEKKKPFMPPGVWVCPEMEDTLCQVYDRNHCSVGVVTTVNASNVTVSLSGKSDVSKANDPSLITQKNSKEIKKVNIDPKVVKMFTDTETGTEDSDSDSEPDNDNTNKDKTIAKENNASSVSKTLIFNNTSSCSESDSEDDFQRDKSRLVKLANGVVLESPINSKEETSKAASKPAVTTLKNKVEEKKEKGKKKGLQKKQEEIASEQNKRNTSIEEKVNKECKVKKNKRKTLLPNTSQIYDGSNQVDDVKKNTKKVSEQVQVMSSQLEVIESSQESTEVTLLKRKKKKKKQDKQPSVVEVHKDIENSGIVSKNHEITPVTEHRKKKKKHEELQTVENEKVKVKKSKEKVIETGNEETLNNLCDTLKKKKKKKKVAV